MSTHPNWLASLTEAEFLPFSFIKLAQSYYLPLAGSIVKWADNNSPRPLVVGINGAQGTGKSTLSKVLKLALEHEHQLNCAILSIDDIYLTRAERATLAEEIHPLLQTRGAPGTHDVRLGIELIKKLKNRNAAQLPVFDKSIDDRAPESDWTSYNTPVDIILFEGWCVGAIPQKTKNLIEPCNELEKTEDKDHKWRTFSNNQLTGAYAELFDFIDKLVMLKAPDFECIHQWRSTQEEKLRACNSTNSEKFIMNSTQIKRFIMHYERLTRWMLAEMPERSDCLLELNNDHHIVRDTYS